MSSIICLLNDEQLAFHDALLLQLMGFLGTTTNKAWRWTRLRLTVR